jgi:hypothetical protein
MSLPTKDYLPSIDKPLNIKIVYLLIDVKLKLLRQSEKYKKTHNHKP